MFDRANNNFSIDSAQLPAPEPSDVEAQLVVLQEQVELLGRSVTLLAERLNPVLAPMEDPKTGELLMVGQAAKTPVGDRINSIARTVAIWSRDTRGLTARLGV